MADQTSSSPEQLEGITQPHANDVLSGRGNFVNQHSGNENFRALVKHHKKAYVACPKNQKAIYSKLIYDEIRSMNPPGRFLKQDPKTKLWNDVGEKKALDKTRQALREGAPELMKELDGTDANSVEYKFENQDALGPLRAARQNNPLANSLMGNISLGSFSLNSQDYQRGAENASTPPVPGIPGQIQMSNPGPGLTQEGANALLVAATQMQLQQQQQQLQLLQQQAGNINPAQLQLLQNHLQMNQQQQQQQNPTLSGGGNNMFLGNNGGYDAALAAAQASSSMGSEQVAALLNAIHNQSVNNSASDMLQQQLTQQLLTQNLLNQMNNPNNTTQVGNFSNNSNQNIQHGFHLQNAAPQHEDSTVAANAMGTSSRARAQRIGVKNSFTQQRRPNRHLKNNDQTMNNSLMSVESINMDQLRMSGVSLGEFTGSEMHRLFESDRTLGKVKDKTDDVSEVSDAMSEDAMSEDEKETSKK
mmetsp:Transcript_6388/g.10383  ORF Transcript_6388/g.10383 Transcript_6388/m.10383 type:complete len:474 (+) Transcript_6388:265-1686(+)